jgi:hypothetical protein
MAASLTQLIGGSFQDANGNVLSYGYLTLKLSQDGNVSGVGNICSGVTITIQLDVNGNVGSSTSPTPVANQYAWANANISPTNTYYKVTGYTQEGQRAFGPNNQQVGSGTTFNLSSWVPNSVISWFPTVAQPLTLEINGSAASSQSIQNLESGSGVTVTDLGNGDISFSSTSTGGPIFEADGESISGWTVVGNVTAGNATTIYSPGQLLECFLIYSGAYAYINTGISSFAGCVIEFDGTAGAGGTNAYLLFGCNSSGSGPFFSVSPGTYGPTGLGASTSWAYTGSAPGEATSPASKSYAASLWVHFRIEINKSGNYATWFANGALIEQRAITLEGSYLGISAYSLNNAYIANIRVYAG